MWVLMYITSRDKAPNFGHKYRLRIDVGAVSLQREILLGDSTSIR
jgi:hypothetical protein